MRWLLATLLSSLFFVGCGNDQTSNNGDSNADANNGGDICADFLAQDDGAGESCEIEDCPTVDCPCEDGSTVGSTSCFNGVCEGRSGCEMACQDFGSAYACQDQSTNSTANSSTNGAPNGSSNGTPNGNPNGSTNGTPNGSTNGTTQTIPTGERCPQFGCTPPVRPATTDCEACEEGKCYVPDSGASYCTLECDEAADCPASFDGNTQRSCVANTCIKGI